MSSFLTAHKHILDYLQEMHR